MICYKLRNTHPRYTGYNERSATKQNHRQDFENFKISIEISHKISFTDLNIFVEKF